MTTLSEVEGRLRGAKHTSGGGYMALCPVHEAEGRHTPSLHLWEEDGKLAWYCFAGCDHRAIGEALGAMNGNGPDPNWTPYGDATAQYRYVDEQGRHLYTVCRTADKQFPVFRDDVTSKTGRRWKEALKNVRHVLYRLPQVQWAVRHGDPVYIVEGEKDADNLIRAGVCATTSPGGAGKWRDDYGSSLINAHVVIIADNDEVGRAHAFNIAASLVGVAYEIEIKQAAQGKDASDHLAAGLDVNEFVKCEGGQDDHFSEPAAEIIATGLPAVTLMELMRNAPERPEYVWYGYIVKGAVTELAAKPKVGKTRLALEVCRCVTTGQELFGKRVEQCAVLYLSEQGRSSFITQAQNARLVEGGELLHVLLKAQMRGMDWDQVGELVLLYVKQHEIGLVVVDTLSDWANMRGDDENSAGAALAALAPLHMIAEGGYAVLAIRHERKGAGDVGESARGSSAFGGGMDVLLSLRRPRGGGHATRRELHAVGRYDDAPPILTVDYDVERSAYKVVGAIGRLEGELDIYNIMPVLERWASSEMELRAATNLAHETTRRALTHLLSQGLIKDVAQVRPDGRGTMKLYYRVWTDPEEVNNDAQGV